MTIALDDPIATSRPQGEAEKRRREDLLLLALLLLEDADVALWDIFAPRQYRGLLLAVAFDNVRDERGELPPFWFDVETQRYGLSRRGFIPMSAIFAALDAFRDALAKAASNAVAQVYAGAVSIGDWQTAFEQRLRQTATTSTALAVGGLARLTQPALDRAGKGLMFPLQRLTRFAGQVEAGVVTEESAGRRAALYPAAVVTGAGGYDDGRRNVHAEVGQWEEINVLSPAEHCLPTAETPGCFEVTGLGWVPLGTLPLPGLRTCAMNCKCRISFRRKPTTEN